ncbi:peptidyl-Lys metalloendopeptidase [Crepidotus variabilis]|uniref:Peptidyl-Lys metalloendopeptidase n=1 Tax=Crepidotus variabilis TaxID=179855 RepID=A0A9P6EHB6_9AGAR|nr:peptidyl-Lys metalloendopeptidase [Crepidotus variabilis]
MIAKTISASLIFLASLTVAVAERALSLRTAGPSSVNSVGSLKVVVTLTNTGDETLKILNDPNGPLSRLPTDTFIIADKTGSTPNFSGVKAKYAPKIAAAGEAFTTLAPGDSVDVEHDLSRAYDFTASGTGTYKIHPNNLFYLVNEDSSIKSIYADTQSSYSAKLSGRLAISRPSVKRATFNGCSASQQTIVNTTTVVAQSYANSTYAYLKKLTKATPRFKSWFGPFTASSNKTVSTVFSKISAEKFSTFQYDCTCPDPDADEGTFAFVYPDSFGTIYLCQAFWDAPLNGTNSKGGTLIHEATHFTVNGGTDDLFYGQTDARSNAITHPDQTLMNADNYEFFAENHPTEA